MQSYESDVNRQRACVCSEFVDVCLAHPRGGGFRSFFRAKEPFVSPADIWTDPRMMPLRRLVASAL